MGKVRGYVSVSLDGYAAGPNQSEENPLGEGGEGLHEWVIKLSSWQQAHGREGGEGSENPSNGVVEAQQENVGAVVMGRNMFGPVRGEWGDSEWRGWWGEDPPFHCPVFVLTHHEREPIEMEGGTSFHFVTDGIESAVAEAKRAAGDQDVSVAGGASTLRQAITAGLLEEVQVNQAPVLLGGGESLFAGLPAAAARFQLAEVVHGPDAVHLRYEIS